MFSVFLRSFGTMHSYAASRQGVNLRSAMALEREDPSNYYHSDLTGASQFSRCKIASWQCKRWKVELNGFVSTVSVPPSPGR